MPDEEKKRAKKLVVEETSTPAPETEDASVEETSVEAIEEPQVETVSETEEAPETQAKPKREKPQGSILIPKGDWETKESLEKSQESDSKVSVLWIIVLVLFIILSLVGGGVLVFRAGVEKGKLEAGGSLEPIPSPDASAEASPSAEVKREDLNIQVLNGTGQAGVAASAQEYLEGLGYQNVEVGNAASSNFTETEISIKDDKKDYSEILTNDLSEEYAVSADVETLDSDSEFDAVITIGTSTN